MSKYKQITEVTIDNKQYSSKDIDISFWVEFDDANYPNAAEISIWNPSADSINRIKKGSSVILNAGYEDNNDIGSIFIGTVGDYESIFTEVNREFKMYVADGLDVWKTKVNKSYSNILASDIVKQLISLVGIGIGKLNVKMDIFYTTFQAVGTFESVLTKIANETDSKFYIKNGFGYFVNKDYTERTAVLLNKDSGLIGQPEKTLIDNKSGYRINLLLEHRLNVSSLVRVESRTVTGNFRVVKGKHSDNFITEVEVLPL